MDYAKLLKLYQITSYEPLVFQDGDPQHVVKYNSVVHYVNQIKAMHDQGIRKTEANSSGDESRIGTFHLFQNLEEAFVELPKLKFDPSKLTKANNLIKKARKSTKYTADDGELEVPEFIAGSDKYWLAPTTKIARTKIVDIPLFINGTYPWHRNCQEMTDMGLRLIEEIYETGIIPKKIIFCFLHCNTHNEGFEGRSIVFVDVSFRDLNALIKVLHSDMFRRIEFRRLEGTYKTLSHVYGNPDLTANEKGFVRLDSLSEGTVKEEVSEFIGIKK